jgi:RNA polymerase-binding transcription factor DksA
MKKKTNNKPKAAKPAKPARTNKKGAVPTVAESLNTTSQVKPVRGEMAKFQKLLLNLRDHVIDQISGLASENLKRNPRESTGDLSGYSFHMADAGTDNFDREFALSLVSNEQEALYEIEEALKRVELGTYGHCENCERQIAKPRLEAVPFARMCVQCQSEFEKTNKRTQGQQPTFADISEESEEDDDE